MVDSESNYSITSSNNRSLKSDDESSLASPTLSLSSSLHFSNSYVPTLIRTSKLSNGYIHENIKLVNTPVVLTAKSDVMSMTLNWTEQEIQQKRRLVKFNFNKTSISQFEVEIEPIAKEDFRPNLPIISCIYWKEKDDYIVTSVDIVLLLEYLIQQSFSIEEKNRIRRNLQSLKPSTVTRSNKSNEDFFQVLMDMEDPRPRNIEKDLKVFLWKDLFLAIEKVVSKYSPNLQHPDNVKYVKQKQPAEDKDASGKKRGISANAKVHKPHMPHSHLLSPSIKREVDADGDQNMTISTSSSTTSTNTTITTTTTTTNKSTTSSMPVDHSPQFMPYERLKVLKRKLNQSNNSQQQLLKGKTKIFQHALTPTDPVPLENETARGSGISKQENGSERESEKLDEKEKSRDASRERNRKKLIKAHNEERKKDNTSDDSNKKPGSGNGLTVESKDNNTEKPSIASGSTPSSSDDIDMNSIESPGGVQKSGSQTDLSKNETKGTSPSSSYETGSESTEERTSDPSSHATSIFSASGGPDSLNTSGATSKSGLVSKRATKPRAQGTFKRPSDLPFDSRDNASNSLQYYQYPTHSVLYLNHPEQMNGKSARSSSNQASAIADKLSSKNMKIHDIEQSKIDKRDTKDHHSKSKILNPTLPSLPTILPSSNITHYVNHNPHPPPPVLPAIRPVYNAPGSFNLPQPVGMNSTYVPYSQSKYYQSAGDSQITQNLQNQQNQHNNQQK